MSKNDKSAEKEMRKTVVKMLKCFDACSIENGCGVGTPDVNLTLGWIELKSVALPKRSATPVRVPHFTTEQKVWLCRRQHNGGMALVFIKVGQWWLLFDAQTAFEILGKVSIGDLTERCIHGWGGTPPKKELIQCLKKIYRTVRDCFSKGSAQALPSELQLVDWASVLGFTKLGNSTKKNPKK